MTACSQSAETQGIRYAAIGDSYSIGEGAAADECWPALLAKDLTAQGIAVQLVANPSRTGWTTLEAIEKELPAVAKARPDFITIQIGVNDWVQGVDAVEYRRRLVLLLEKARELLADPQQIVLVNIPDFSVAPQGRLFGDPHTISSGIASFNAVIAEEAARLDLTVVDIFELSQEMGRDPSLVAQDGLHPSAKEYAEWEKRICPAVQTRLNAKLRPAP